MPGAKFCFLVQTDHLESATRKISCEIRALYPEQLNGALDAVLRSVTVHAALTEAVLETRRRHTPRLRRRWRASSQTAACP
jgi:hypothetical protein